jgi:hypothetical protein
MCPFLEEFAVWLAPGDKAEKGRLFIGQLEVKIDKYLLVAFDSRLS